MAERKRKMGEHVTLSKESVNKLLESARSPEAKFLDPWDILALERAERTVFDAKAALSDAGHRLAILKLEHDKLLQGLLQEQAERHRQLGQARQAAKELAGSLASRYCIDWSTHVFNPETGEITQPE